MPRYETVFITASAVPEDEVETIVSHLESVVADSGGTLHKTERWGRRKLAYPVRKNREGNYTLFLYDSEPGVVTELERRIRMNDRLIRHLTIRSDTAALPSAAEQEELAARRAELRRRAEERARRRADAEKLAAESGEDFSVEEWERQADEEERRRAREEAAAQEAAAAAAAAGIDPEVERRRVRAERGREDDEDDRDDRRARRRTDEAGDSDSEGD